MNNNNESNNRYELFSCQIWVMAMTAVLLACASIFSQNGYDNFYIKPVSTVAFLLTLAYFLFHYYHDKGFYGYFLERFREYSKTPVARSISLSTLIIIILRFLLPHYSIYFIQNFLYVAAGVFLLFGTVSLFLRR